MDHFLANSDKVDWTMYIIKAKTFNTYAEAEAKLEELPKEFYQIDKIFRVK